MENIHFLDHNQVVSLWPDRYLTNDTKYNSNNKGGSCDLLWYTEYKDGAVPCCIPFVRTCPRNMASPGRENPPYWPGGIPSHVRCHDQPIPWHQFDDEIQGWLLYLDVRISVCPLWSTPRKKPLLTHSPVWGRKMPCHAHHRQMAQWMTMTLRMSYDSGGVLSRTGPP